MGILRFFGAFWRNLIGQGDRLAPEVSPSVPTTDTAAPKLWSPEDPDPEPSADFDRDLDAAFGGLFEPDGVSKVESPRAVSDHDDESTRELFTSIADNYARPVKNFVVELQRGAASKEWVEICQPVMGTIVEGAQSLGLNRLAERATEFREALSLANACQGAQIGDESRELILSCYEGLVEELPGAFTLAEQDERRESIIVHSLLRQIPDVGHVTFERLYGAGVTSLDALFLVNGPDLEATTGVPLWLCERICDKVQEHRAHLEGTGADDSSLDNRSRLVELIKELKRYQDAFEEVAEVDANRPELAAKKRDCLRNRQACALQINVALAELGEVDLVDELKKLAIERRVHRLEAYLMANQPAAPAAAQLNQAE